MSRIDLSSDSKNSWSKCETWIAFDLEWEFKAEVDRNRWLDPGSPLHKCNFTSGTSVPPIYMEYHRIITFGYEDALGNRSVLDISDFLKYPDPDKVFLSYVREKLLQYRYCFSWGSKATRHVNKQTSVLEGVNGDLAMLDTNLKRNGIPSIVRYDKFTGKPSIHNYKLATTDIDLCTVFAKPLVRQIVFKNRYKSLKLGEVAIALLGYGKLNDECGSSINKMTADRRKAYCMHDAHLVAELVRIDDGNILKMMDIIAHHTGLNLVEVCEKGMVGIWTKILNEAVSRKVNLVGYNGMPTILRRLYSRSYKYPHSDFKEIEDDIEEPEIERNNDDEGDENICNKNTINRDDMRIAYHDYYCKEKNPGIRTKEPYKKYRGAIVIEPVRGIHQDVSAFDVTSLYPTIIIKYNLSPETINCSCCKDDLKAKRHVTSEILNGCQYTGKEGACWICQRKTGLFPKVLDSLTKERIKYKKNGLEIESQAIKAVINSGYGVFGHPYFKYYDPRVAELVTAFGRYTLTKMQMIARKLGFIVLYGDTDSLFVRNVDSHDSMHKFINECESNLGVIVGHERTFAKLILTGKKHYIGLLSDSSSEPVIKGMEGLKSDRPEFIHKVFRQLVDDIKCNRSPIPRLKKAFDDLEHRNVPSKELAISLPLRKNPEDYDLECRQSRIGRRLHLSKGMTLVYYKTHREEIAFEPATGKRRKKILLESDDPDDISYAEYKKMMLNSVKDVVRILGYDIDHLTDTGKKWVKESVYFRK